MSYIEKTKGVLAAMTGAKPARMEDVLEELRRHGEPSLLGYGPSSQFAGWRCKCELYTSAAGLTAAIASEWRHQTPLAAAEDCLSRVLAAKASMGC